MPAFQSSAFQASAFQTTEIDTLPFGDALDLFLQILPAASASPVQKHSARISADTVPLAFTDYEFALNEGRIGATLTVTCSDMSQRALVASASAFKYERYIGGVWETRLDTASLQSRDFAVAWGDSGPADTFSFTIYDNRFELAPTQARVIYDPARLQMDAADFEVKKDTEGNEYTTELETMASLSLHKLFQRVFVDELGFTAYRTNLPDFQIRRVDFPLTSNWISPLSEKIGMFEPLIFAVGTEVWIEDGTLVLTDGLPDPPALTVANYERLQVSAERAVLDGYEVDYIANENEFDDTLVRIETPPDEIVGTFGEDDYTRTAIQIYYLDFYKDGQVVREQYEATFKQIYGVNPWTGVSMQVGAFEEQISYNSQGEQTGSTVIEKELVPNYSGSAWTFSLDEVSRKENGYTYAGHPYKQDSRILKRQTSTQTGKVVVDEDNPVFGDQPFKLAFRDALRGGNITESTTIEDSPVYSFEENFTVETRDRVRVRGKKRDLLKGVTPTEYDEPRTGDISIDGSTTETKPVIVLPSDGYALTGKPLRSKSINELPLEYGIPLVRRDLNRLQNKPYSFNCEIQGLVAGMRQGATRTLYARGGEALGVMLVEGFRESGSGLGTPDRKFTTVISGRQI
jgi:hypothetical protein